MSQLVYDNLDSIMAYIMSHHDIKAYYYKLCNARAFKLLSELYTAVTKDIGIVI